MCGRYSLTSPVEALRSLFNFSEQPNLAPRYNIAPGTDVAVVRDIAGRRELVFLRWGFVPRWAKPGALKPMINARAETVADKPTFKTAAVKRRCLVPADGFYEWKVSGKGAKQPYFIKPANAHPIAFAGIWETWTGPDGETLETVAIITTAANRAMAPIHHRMPAVIAAGDFATWLDPAGTKAALALLQPAHDGLFQPVAVSVSVNKVANDSADIQQPVGARPPQSTAQDDLFDRG